MPLRLVRAFSLPLAIVAWFFGVFSLGRLALLLAQGEQFAGLTRGEIAWAFVRGLRFDAAIIFFAIGVPVFLLLLPVGGRRWRGFWGWLCFALLALFACVIAGDIGYFGFVGRHVGVEINSLRESLGAVGFTGAIQYPLPSLAFLAGLGALFVAWRRMLRWPPPLRADVGARVALALLCVTPIYVAAKGTIHGKRLKIVAAFEGVHDEAEAYLALNGPFSVLHSMDFTKPVKVAFFPWREALETTRQALFAPGETPVRDDYPMLRARAAGGRAKPNVVLIMLESWDARAVDAHRREMGLEPLGLTPSYDALAREGRLLSRFYAVGQRSMDGMSALLAGLPSLPRTPYLGRGVEQSGLPFLGRIAQEEGYRTLFIQSSKRAAFRNDAIAALAGFETYEGAEDVPPDAAAVSRAPLGGEAWDGEMFAEASRRLGAAKPPFLAFLYTATTHTPYSWPSKAWERFAPDSSQARYWNSIAYADHALGELFAAAKREGWFDSTIFIVTADHVGGPNRGIRVDPPEAHHIPGLIVAPGLAPGVDARIGSQLDVIPTIAALAGWGAPQSALGRSLLDDGAAPRGAFCIEGDLILRIEPDGFVLHDLVERVRSGARGDGADIDGIQKRLLSIYQVAATLTRQNRLYPALAH